MDQIPKPSDQLVSRLIAALERCHAIMVHRVPNEEHIIELQTAKKLIRLEVMQQMYGYRKHWDFPNIFREFRLRALAEAIRRRPHLDTVVRLLLTTDTQAEDLDRLLGRVS